MRFKLVSCRRVLRPMERTGMIENDKTVYEKMLGIWSITKIPALRMTPHNGEVGFFWQQGPILRMPFKAFEDMAPIEMVNLIEKEIDKVYGINAKQFRSDLSGYMANPFSSQR